MKKLCKHIHLLNIIQDREKGNRDAAFIKMMNIYLNENNN